MSTVGWIVAIVGTWVLVALLLAGCGFLVRSLLVRIVTGRRAGMPALLDVWIGLAALLGYLEIWSLFRRTDELTWILPVAAGGVGALFGGRAVLRERGARRRRPLAALMIVVAAALFLADNALLPANSYDVGLYHASAIDWASNYPAIPGLANLALRLGNGNAYFLFVGFLDQGPWAGAGIHLAGGLLLTLLIAELVARIARDGRAATFTTRLALLLLPATVILIAAAPDDRIASSNLDTATFVLVFVGALYLAEAVERGPSAGPTLASMAGFSAAAVTRPLYWLPTLVAGAILAAAWRREREVAAVRTAGALVLIGVIPGALALGWLGRQLILSGYPFYPLPVAGLPVDWRVPHATVVELEQWIQSWARRRASPDEVLDSWAWVHWWFDTHLRRDLDLVAPLALLAATAPFLALRGSAAGGRRRMLAMLAVFVTAGVTVAAWFFEAPDPRFALGVIWLIPIALAAWAMPELPGTSWMLPTLVAAVAAGFLTRIGSEHLEWLIPATVILWWPVALVVRLAVSERKQAWVAWIAVGSVLVATVVVGTRSGSMHIPVEAYPGGAFGTPPLPVPQLEQVSTSSGLQVSRPTESDRCWSQLLCTPDFSPELRLRGRDVGDGFARTAADSERLKRRQPGGVALLVAATSRSICASSSASLANAASSRSRSHSETTRRCP